MEQSKDVRRILAAMLDVLADANSSNGLRFLEALGHLMAEKSAHENKPFFECSVSPIEIAEHLSRPAQDHETQKKYVDNNLLKRLEQDLVELQGPLKDHLVANGFRKILVPAKVSGDGRRKNYTLQLRPLNDLEPEAQGLVSVSSSKSDLTYQQHFFDGPNFIARRLQRIELFGRKGFFFLFMMLVPAILLSVFLIILIGNFSLERMVYFFGAAVLCFLFY